MVELPKRLETALVAAQLSVDDFLTYFLYFSRIPGLVDIISVDLQKIADLNHDAHRALDF